MMQEFEKACPQTHRAIYGRKFLLPHYRQGDYANQDELNARIETDLLALAVGVIGVKDDVLNCQFANYCSAFANGRPTLFLERELGLGLVDSPLPADMATEDIHWPWPQLRVMLPKGLLGIEREGKFRDMDYLDISIVDETGSRLPDPYATELDDFAANFAEVQYGLKNTMVCRGETYICVATQTIYSEKGIGATTYGYTAPWTNKTLGQLTGYKGGMAALLECDDKDDLMLEQMKRLAINVLLFLSQKPFEQKPVVRRPMRIEGKHMKPALHDARFVGREMYKAAILKVKGPGTVTATGRQIPAHFVKGHWTRQPHGPKRSLRRYQWIGFYWTKGPDGKERQDGTA